LNYPDLASRTLVLFRFRSIAELADDDDRGARRDADTTWHLDIEY